MPRSKELKLTTKQKRFLTFEADPKYNQVQAYRKAFNNYTGADTTIKKEAQLILKNPLSPPFKEKLNNKIVKKLEYSILDSFNKLNKIQDIALDGVIAGSDKDGGLVYKQELSSALKAEELKGKLFKLYAPEEVKGNNSGGNVNIIIATYPQDKAKDDNDQNNKPIITIQGGNNNG